MAQRHPSAIHLESAHGFLNFTADGLSSSRPLAAEKFLVFMVSSSVTRIKDDHKRLL